MIFFQICLPLMGVAVLAGIVANCLQVGFLFTAYPLQPKLERINPIEGCKRIFSRRALVELFKASVKIFLVAYVAYSTIVPNMSLFPALLDMSINNVLKSIGELCSQLFLRTTVLLLVLAVFDYAFQYWEHDKSLKMSKKELKEEYRQYEGDPYVRSRIRQRQRQLSVSRMMQEVPKADVVITNPTHYAVALRYLPGEMPAPVIIAKGIDNLALRIKALAEEHKIIIYEDPALAQALYKSVDVGKIIPPELYEAVARVLAFIYRLQPARWERTS
jgi:flagellar biosynthetic protein FlhB